MSEQHDENESRIIEAMSRALLVQLIPTFRDHLAIYSRSFNESMAVNIVNNALTLFITSILAHSQNKEDALEQVIETLRDNFEMMKEKFEEHKKEMEKNKDE